MNPTVVSLWQTIQIVENLMTHFGIICPGSTGPLNTMLPLGQELQRRGHRVTLFGLPDTEQKTLVAGVEFQPIGLEEFPVGWTKESFTQLGKLKGLAALKCTVNFLKQGAAVMLRDAPTAMKAAGVDAVLVNQGSVEGGTVADILNIPFVTVCSAVILNRDPNIPPFNTSWNYSSSILAQFRNRMGYALLNRVAQPIRDVIHESRQQWNLPPHLHPNDVYSKLAQISQAPAEFEFPRKNLPAWFHFTGPFHFAWTGAGEMITLKSLSVPKLRSAVEKVLTQESYKQNALRLQQGIQQAGGVERAAEIIEQVISTQQPVLAQK